MASADDTISFKAQKGKKTALGAQSGKTDKIANSPKAVRNSKTTKGAQASRPIKKSISTQDAVGNTTGAGGGRIHAKKRAVRKEEKSSSKLQQLAAWYSKLGNYRALLMILGGIVLVVVALYSPLRSWYSAQRDAELYTKQLQTLKNDNAALQENVTRLQSKEGIEDEARKRGYVVQGETSVTINGMKDGGEAKADASKNSLDGVATDDPWYIKVLDVVFFYQAPTIHE